MSEEIDKLNDEKLFRKYDKNPNPTWIEYQLLMPCYRQMEENEKQRKKLMLPLLYLTIIFTIISVVKVIILVAK